MPRVDPPANEPHRKESQSGREAKREGSMQAMASKRESSSHNSSSSSRPKPPTKIDNGRFEIDKALGAGCFGVVYRGKNMESNSEVAVKFEDLQARTQQLEQEWTILQLLNKPPQPQGFSECFYFGREGRYHCLVLELLGLSLEDCVQQCKGTLKPLTTALIAEQLIRRLEYLHSKGIIHRDIKPENFMWGRKSKIHHVFMIDFGLSKRYYDKQHVAMREKLSLTGTARYASINAHRGVEQSRRDDLEAVGHMLLYFLRGVLPWSGLDAKTKDEKYRRIRQKKEETPLAELCKGFPPEFQRYLEYTRGLEFVARPDYKYLRELFHAVRTRLGPAEDHHLEWLEEKDISPETLEPLNPWTPPKQPDDVDPEASSGFRRHFCFCGGKQPKNDA